MYSLVVSPANWSRVPTASCVVNAVPEPTTAVVPFVVTVPVPVASFLTLR